MAAATEPEPMLPRPHRVAARVAETYDSVTLTLVPVDGPLAVTAPGQFMMVWAFGVGEIPISVSAVGDGGAVLLTVRSVGAVSAAVVAAQPGDVLGLRGPYGTAWPVAEAMGRDVVVVAGGLGIAPLRMAIEALATRASERLSIVLGARQPDELVFAPDLARWAAMGAHVHTTVDVADRAWHGAVGTATALLERLGEAHDVAFVCGPEPMMTSGARALVALGTPPSGVHVSLERNMHCGIAHCGRCQLGPFLLCRDGAVVRWPEVADLLEVRGR